MPQGMQGFGYDDLAHRLLNLLLQLATLIHLDEEIATSDELCAHKVASVGQMPEPSGHALDGLHTAIDVALRNSRPVGVRFDALTNLVVSEYIKRLKVLGN